MILNQAMFNDNAKCGYVLKPDILLDNKFHFDPLNLNTMKHKKIFEIKIISGQRLPNNKDIIKDISDPYVLISIHGIKADASEKRTKRVKDNGFNPIWNEKFEFIINCPELAFVKFTVKDDDFGHDQLIGYYAVRFQNIREGPYNILKLFLSH